MPELISCGLTGMLATLYLMWHQKFCPCSRLVWILLCIYTVEFPLIFLVIVLIPNNTHWRTQTTLEVFRSTAQAHVYLLIECFPSSCLSIRWVSSLRTNMTANKCSKAVPRAGGGKAPQEVPDRSVTSGTSGVGWLMCTSMSQCVKASELTEIKFPNGNERLDKTSKPFASVILYPGRGPRPTLHRE